MPTRPAVPADLPALTDLQRAVDTAWFGAPEHDEQEVAELFALAGAERRLVVHDDDGSLVAAAWWHGPDTTLLIHPNADPGTLTHLFDRIVEAGAPQVETLDRDRPLRDELTARGWRHHHSTFDLARPVSADWTLPAPQWPIGVELRPVGVDDLPALHDLVYRDAGWTDVLGHHWRSLDEWRAIFSPGPDDLAGHLAAWRADRPVGLALRRTFSDGTGWVNQLAVAADQRRIGLARALLLESMRRHRSDGATALGLGVSAVNAHALDLYLGVGLRIDREWQTFIPGI